jgi:putrescine transport system substrate-binding protein
MVVNELYYANANEAAREFIDPAILNDPLVYPPEDAIRNAEIVLPLSPAGQKLYGEIWQRFLETQP